MVCGDDGASVHISEVMAEYQCFKVVQAAEIKSVAQLEESNDLSLIIGIPGTDVDLPYLAAEELTQRYKPETGDYLVLYENGYVSISPKKVFEDGYSKIEFADFEGADDLGIPKEHMGQVLAIAKMCHEVNRAYCKALREEQPTWETAPKWQVDSAIKGVAFHILNPDAPASASHDSWMSEKVVNGWKYGKEKCEKQKTHPCMVPFHHLPVEQQAKDHIFSAIVKTAIGG
jgi:hypothetical protein